MSTEESDGVSCRSLYRRIADETSSQLMMRFDPNVDSGVDEFMAARKS